MGDLQDQGLSDGTAAAVTDEPFDVTHIEAVVAVLRDSPGLTELDIEQDGTRLRLRRPVRHAGVPAVSGHAGGNGAFPAGPVAANVGTAAAEKGAATAADTPFPPPPPVAATAGLVGVFHALPGEAAVTVGTMVAERQVLGQIESMRLMNDCLAPAGGRIVGVHVGDGQPVEYGQILFEIASPAGNAV